MNLHGYVEQCLEQSAVMPEQLQELLVRLLNYGVLVRDNSQTARELYARFVRVEGLVTEILALQAIQLHHDRRFEYVRLYPPGSRTPGMGFAEEQAFGSSLRARPTQNEAEVVLRAQYDKAVRKGKIDGQGYAAEPLDAIGPAMKKRLNCSLPERLSNRRDEFRRLRKLRTKCCCRRFASTVSSIRNSRWRTLTRDLRSPGAARSAETRDLATSDDDPGLRYAPRQGSMIAPVSVPVPRAVLPGPSFAGLGPARVGEAHDQVHHDDTPPEIDSAQGHDAGGGLCGSRAVGCVRAS